MLAVMTQENGVQTARVAVVTGGSRGLGRAFTISLVRRGWHVVIDARDPVRLTEMVAEIDIAQAVTAVPGDVRDPRHRLQLAAAAAEAGGLDLLVNNASMLGPSPQPRLAAYPLEVLERVYEVNTLAPLALFQVLLPQLAPRSGRVVNVSSDAAVEPYPGWGGYGSAKAALDQLTAVLAVEHPQLRVYSFDPGDMATDLHQQAFPGDDISDRPSPERVVPALLALAEADLPSGRYRAAELMVEIGR
jgi:NAD(P)-dependent dehydrogenase (short-subunit alcohol dehydrogenase family)